MKMDSTADLGPDAPPASPEVFRQLGTITRQLHDTLTELGVMPKLQRAADYADQASLATDVAVLWRTLRVLAKAS